MALTYRSTSSRRRTPLAATKPGRTSRRELGPGVADGGLQRRRHEPVEPSLHPCGGDDDPAGGRHRVGGDVGKIGAGPLAQREEPLLVPRHRPVLVDHAVGGGDRAVVGQAGERDPAAAADGEPHLVRHVPLHCLATDGHGEQQQPAHARAHHPLLDRRVRQHADRHAVAVVEQGGVTAHGMAVPDRLDEPRQGGEVPRAKPGPLEVLSRLGDRRPRPAAEPGAELLEVLAQRDPAPIRILHGERDPEVVGDPGDVERARWDPLAGEIDTTRASSSTSAPPAGSTCSKASRARSAIGMSNRRYCLGSERTSAPTSSSRNPGTCQSNPWAATRFNTASGTCTVTPSPGSPGSNVYVTGSTRSSCRHVSG